MTGMASNFSSGLPLERDCWLKFRNDLGTDVGSYTKYNILTPSKGGAKELPIVAAIQSYFAQCSGRCAEGGDDHWPYSRDSGGSADTMLGGFDGAVVSKFLQWFAMHHEISAPAT